MRLTFSKTLLATMVFMGLTACGSGGGSSPTASSDRSNTITVPNISNQGNYSSNQSNTSGNQSIPSSTTFKIGKDGYATGKATYASPSSSIVLNADFDKRSISGYAKGHINGQTIDVTLHETTLYKRSSPYSYGGWRYTSLNENYDFKGRASSVSPNNEKFIGEYGGTIHGKVHPFDTVNVGYYATSEKGSSIYEGVDENNIHNLKAGNKILFSKELGIQ